MSKKTQQGVPEDCVRCPYCDAAFDDARDLDVSYGGWTAKVKCETCGEPFKITEHVEFSYDVQTVGDRKVGCRSGTLRV